MGSVNINGTKIKLLREENNLTQLYLATIVGVTTDTISRWENKKYPSIKYENAEKLAEALNVPLDDILEHEETVPQTEATIPPGMPIEKEQRGRNKFKGMLIGGISVLVLVTAAYMVIKPTQNVATFVSASRYMPPHVAPNVPFPVIVHLDADGHVDAPLLVRETLEGKASAYKIEPSGVKKDFGKNPRWIGHLTEGKADFLYMVLPDKTLQQGDTLQISGDCLSGKTEKKGSKIQGPAKVPIKPLHWADTNGDYIITDNEILEAYEKFSVSGNVSLTFNDLESLWLAGKYRWDATHSLFVAEEVP